MLPTTSHALEAAVAFAGGSRVEETIERAVIDEHGQLHITTSLGREIVPRKRGDQVGFERVAISADRRAVGWLALYPNCCTTYPIALKLVVYSKGRERSFAGSLSIARWTFSKNSKQVSYREETVHSSQGVHYELRDVATGRLAATYDPDRTNPGTPPHWVQYLDAVP